MTAPSQTEQANLEKVREAIDAFNHRDREAMLAMGDDDFVYDWTRSLGVNARVYQGRAELMEFIEDQWSIFEDQHLEAHEDIPRGNRVVVTATVHGRGRQGVPVSATSAHLYTFADDGQLGRITLFQGREGGARGGGVRFHEGDPSLRELGGSAGPVKRKVLLPCHCRLSRTRDRLDHKHGARRALVSGSAV